MVPFDLLQQVDTSIIGLSPVDAVDSPYIASMGVYAFKTDVLLKLLRSSYPTANDFGSEIIPSVVKEHNVQVGDHVSFHLGNVDDKRNNSTFFSPLFLVCIDLGCCYDDIFLQAYIFRDYWEDIGTIKSFYDANLALTDEVELFCLCFL